MSDIYWWEQTHKLYTKLVAVHPLNLSGMPSNTNRSFMLGRKEMKQMPMKVCFGAISSFEKPEQREGLSFFIFIHSFTHLFIHFSERFFSV